MEDSLAFSLDASVTHRDTHDTKNDLRQFFVGFWNDLEANDATCKYLLPHSRTCMGSSREEKRLAVYSCEGAIHSFSKHQMYTRKSMQLQSRKQRKLKKQSDEAAATSCAPVTATIYGV